MARNSKPSPEDRALFRNAIGPVKRLNNDRVDLTPDRPTPYPRSTEADERQVLDDMISDYFEPADMDTGEEIIYRREGIQQNVMRKLRRGQFRVSAVLDLHGMSVDAARKSLIAFLRNARHDSMTCVRIIHGKGNRSRHKGPVIKHKLNHWLRQRDEVLAFCSARPVDGGTGAIYLLLKRHT